jgi:hypothetical protein
VAAKRAPTKATDLAIEMPNGKPNTAAALEGIWSRTAMATGVLAAISVVSAWPAPKAEAAKIAAIPQLHAPASSTLRPETLQGFQHYALRIEARVERELAAGADFLFLDALPPERRAAAYAALRKGQARIEQLQPQVQDENFSCPGGMILHWRGIVFVPGANLDQALALVQDYNRQAELYAPEVVRSRVLAHSGDDYKIYLRLRRQSVITVVLDTEHAVHYTRLDAQHAASRSISTSVREVADAGKPSEHDLPADTGGGYLWRINTYWRFVERDGGVYVECESVSLTRDIPTGLGWLVGPFVNNIPRESLAFTLNATRRALLHN